MPLKISFLYHSYSRRYLNDVTETSSSSNRIITTLCKYEIIKTYITE